MHKFKSKVGFNKSKSLKAALVIQQCNLVSHFDHVVLLLLKRLSTTGVYKKSMLLWWSLFYILSREHKTFILWDIAKALFSLNYIYMCVCVCVCVCVINLMF